MNTWQLALLSLAVLVLCLASPASGQQETVQDESLPAIGPSPATLWGVWPCGTDRSVASGPCPELPAWRGLCVLTMREGEPILAMRGREAPLTQVLRCLHKQNGLVCFETGVAGDAGSEEISTLVLELQDSTVLNGQGSLISTRDSGLACAHTFGFRLFFTRDHPQTFGSHLLLLPH